MDLGLLTDRGDDERENTAACPTGDGVMTGGDVSGGGGRYESRDSSDSTRTVAGKERPPRRRQSLQRDDLVVASVRVSSPSIPRLVTISRRHAILRGWP